MAVEYLTGSYAVVYNRQELGSYGAFTYDSGEGTARMLLVTVTYENGISGPTGISYGGEPLYQIKKIQNDPSSNFAESIEVWGLLAPQVGEHTLAFSGPNGSQDSTATALVFTGVNQTSPVGTIAANSTGSSGPTSTTITIDKNSVDNTIFWTYVYDQGNHLMEGIPDNVNIAIAKNLNASGRSFCYGIGYRTAGVGPVLVGADLDLGRVRANGVIAIELRAIVPVTGGHESLYSIQYPVKTEHGTEYGDSVVLVQHETTYETAEVNVSHSFSYGGGSPRMYPVSGYLVPWVGQGGIRPHTTVFGARPEVTFSSVGLTTIILPTEDTVSTGPEPGMQALGKPADFAMPLSFRMSMGKDVPYIGLSFTLAMGRKLEFNIAFAQEWEIEGVSTSLGFDMEWELKTSQSAEVSRGFNQEWETRAKQNYVWEHNQMWGLGEVSFGFDQKWAIPQWDWVPKVLALMNQDRVNLGRVNMLTQYLGPRLELATEHARNMSNTGVYAHESEDFPSGYEALYGRFGKLGVPYSWATENIMLVTLDPNAPEGYPYITPEFAHQSWKNSPGHYGNYTSERPEGADLQILIGLEFLGTGVTNIPGAETAHTAFAVSKLVDLSLYGDEPMIKEREFNQSYRVDAAVVELYNAVWNTDAYVHVSARNEIRYSIRVGAQHESRAGAGVSAQHEVPLFYTLSVTHSTKYGQFVSVGWEHETKYQESGFARSQLGAQYGDAVIVTARHTVEYSRAPRAVSDLELQYEGVPQILAQHEAAYEGMKYLTTDHEVMYEGSPSAQKDHETQYEGVLQILAQNETAYEPMGYVTVEHELTYMSAPRAWADHETQYDETSSILRGHTTQWALRGRASTQHGSRYADQVLVEAQNKTYFDINVTNPVRRNFGTFYTLSDDAPLIMSGQVSVTIRGEEVDHDSVSVSKDDGDLGWKGTISLTGVADYTSAKRKDDVVISLGGEEYRMVVDSKSLSRADMISNTMTLGVVSPSVLLTDTTPGVVSHVQEVPIKASALVTLLLGEPVAWNVIDWTIPSYRYAVREVSKAEAAQKVADACGALLETAPDGSLEVNYRYPTSMNKLSLENSDFTLTDEDDNISQEESLVFSDTVNRVRIRELPSSVADRIDFVQDEERKDKGTLYVYPQPWRNSVAVEPTRGGAITLVYRGVESRQEVEQVEFTGGEAGLSYPSTGILLVEWHSAALGSVGGELRTPKVYASDTSTNYGYGLATITYEVEAMVYDIQMPLGQSAQFIVVDTGG